MNEQSNVLTSLTDLSWPYVSTDIATSPNQPKSQTSYQIPSRHLCPCLVTNVLINVYVD